MTMAWRFQAVGAVAVFVCAASPAAQQRPTFRSGVTLVVVDVSVLDSDGKPVTGLGADDFTVTLDGHAAPVRTASYEQAAVESSGGPAPRQPVPVREATNARPAAQPRVFVIVADDLSMAPSRGKRMLFAASRFVSGLPASDLVGFTTTSRETTINPTLNHAAIEAALRHTVGEFNDPRALPPADVAVGIGEGLQIAHGDEITFTAVVTRECNQGQTMTAAVIATSSCADEVRRKAQAISDLESQTSDRQIGTYLDVFNAMREAPGLKQVLLVSDGLALTPRTTEDLKAVGRAAALDGVQLSVLFEEPDPNIMDSAHSAQVRRSDDQTVMLSGAQTVADMTGGTFYRAIGAPDPFYARVALASTGLYHLGVEAPAGSAPGQDFALSVKVNRRGLVVHANRHAVTPTPPAHTAVDDQLRTAVINGAPLYGVPVTAAALLRRSAQKDKIDVNVDVEVPSTVEGPLAARLGLVDEKGTLHTMERTAKAPANGGSYRISLVLPVPPGAYQLRVAVADAGGHIGSVDLGVPAHLAQIGPFEASDLLTSWSGSSGQTQLLTLHTLPAEASVLRVFLELYPGSGAPAPSDVRVRFGIVTDDPAARVLGTQEATPVVKSGTLYSAGGFSVSSLPAGDYLLTASVVIADKVAGTVTTPITKPGGTP